MASFDTPSGIPYSDVNLRTKSGHAPKWSPDSSTSEVTTIQLEFRDLSRVTGDPRYEDAVSRVSRHVHSLPKTHGLVPIFINANNGQFRSYSTITLGARGDSYYEYLLKQVTRRHEFIFFEMRQGGKRTFWTAYQHKKNLCSIPTNTYTYFIFSLGQMTKKGILKK